MLSQNFHIGETIFWSISSNSSKWINANIEEFFSCKTEKNATKNSLNITCNKNNHLPSKAVMISKNLYYDSDCIYIEDKFKSDEFLSIRHTNNIVEIKVSENFTFYYYAKLVDELIKLIGVSKDLIFLHASSHIFNKDEVYAYCAWRRIGKTTIALFQKKHYKQTLLSDDALFIDIKNKTIIPYIRGIDLYSYLDIDKSLLSKKAVIQRHTARILMQIPLFKSIWFKIARRFFTPRLNIARIQETPTTYKPEKIKFFGLTIIKNDDLSIKKWDFNNAYRFFIDTAFDEINETLLIFKAVKSIYPSDKTTDLYINEVDFSEKYKSLFTKEEDYFLIGIPETYTDLDKIFKNPTL